MLELQKIHHVAIIVSDYEKSREFYVNKLGFAVIRENYRPDRGDWKLDLKRPQRVTNPEAYGLRHLAFHVENVEQTVAELNALGIETEPIRWDEFTGKRMTFFKDPDGLPLEIHE